MAEAKVIINIKEGVIELEGPVDFVKHYLDKYQGAIKGLQGLPEEKVTTPEQFTPLPRKRREPVAPKKVKPKRGDCTKAIKSYMKEGFFDEPRSMKDIKQHITEAGVGCTDTTLRAALKRLVVSGSLGTTGSRLSLRYHRPGRE